LPVSLLLGLVATPAFAKPKVFACEPEWGAMVTELAGDKVDLSVGTTALQDVHQIEAKPSLIAKVRQADLIACTGSELEVGWLPQLLKQSGNAKVASGNGYFMASEQVQTLERPPQRSIAPTATCIRAAIRTCNSIRIACCKIAKALDARLVALDPANAATLQAAARRSSTRWQAAIKRWEAKAAPLKGKKVVVHHISWVYLNTWLGLQQIGALEPKPGVPPTSGHCRA
jgi:zinc/manganese transport system substrate-binding protein